LAEKGIETVPIPRGFKGPSGIRFEGWTVRKFGPEDFFPDDGIGIRHSLLKAVDRDCPEAVRLVELGISFLPKTLYSGHASTPQAHSWYLTADEPRYQKHKDVDGTTLIELRTGAGLQTCIPPTHNPEYDEPYVWHNPGQQIATLPAKELERLVRLDAAASLIARHYPPEGGQYDFGLYMAGLLMFHGIDEETAYDLMAAAYQAAGYYLDSTAAKNIRGVCKTTAARLDNEEATAGGPSLVHDQATSCGTVRCS
jgi:hypothetical protein